MINFSMISLLTSKVQKDPGIIVGPIAKVLGFILNAIFSVISLLSEHNSLGFSIIFFTLIVRALMIPFAVKQQKSMGKMQQLQPEIEKIKKKYGDSKDPELQKKMNTEIQALYSKSGANPLSGCLPIFIQFPIFIALNYCMQQSFMFISRLNDIYRGIAELIYSVTDWAERIGQLASYKIVRGDEFVISETVNLMKVLNKFREADWTQFFENFSGLSQVPAINELLTQKHNIEFFFSINLLENPGFTLPAILIPILSAATSFYSSWQMGKQNKSAEGSSKTQQQVMLYAMPAMMLYFTFTMPAGVGLYWVVSTIFQIFQQMILNKRYNSGEVNTAKTIDGYATEKKEAGKAITDKKSVKNKK